MKRIASAFFALLFLLCLLFPGQAFTFYGHRTAQGRLLAARAVSCGTAPLVELRATYRDAPETSVPDFKQADPRWANVPYSYSGNPAYTIGSSGCGLCAMADIVAAWYDPDATPLDMARISVKEHTVSYNGGTEEAFHWFILDYYPFFDFCETEEISDVIECLLDGGLVIVKFKSGGWNPDKRKRHACCIYAVTVTNDGIDFWLHDPGWPEGLMSQIMGHGTYDAVKNSAEKFWCYWK